MSTDITWGTPPPAQQRLHSRQVRQIHLVEVLKSRPGAWAQYPWPLKRSSMEIYVRHLPRKYPGVEVIHDRADDPNDDVLWVRWNGG